MEEPELAKESGMEGRGDAETQERGEEETGDWRLETGEGSQSPVASNQSLFSDPALAETERLRAELEEARGRGLESHRRALLAENAGRVVPELVAGSTVEELESSLEVARGAFEAARAAALAGISATPIPAGNPVRQSPNIEGMSPMEKIAYGLRRD